MLRRQLRKPLLRSLTRSFTQPSSSRLAPAVALAEAESDDHQFSYHHSPSPRQRPHVVFPSPLPSDITPDPQSALAALYPTTGVLDQISLISICLRRPEHIPRAYQIFKQFIEAAEKSGQGQVLDAEVWGRVIEGSASLGKDGSPSSDQWRRRAHGLVMKWNALHGVSSNLPAGLEQGGFRVYQGYLAGLLKSGAPLEPIIPYLHDPAMPVERLLQIVDISDVPNALDRLSELAKRNSLYDLAKTIRKLQGIQVEIQGQIHRQSVAEIQPVLEHNADESQTRFAISNLRKTLEPISSPSLPMNRQLKIEQASYSAAKAELERTVKQLQDQGSVFDDLVLRQGQLQMWMHSWLGLLTAKLKEDIMEMREKVGSTPMEEHDGSSHRWNSSTRMKDSQLFLYMTLLPVDKLALVVILEVMRMTGSGGITDGMKTLRGLLAVGKAVETEYRAETIKSAVGTESRLWQRALDPQTQKPSRRSIGQVWSDLGRKNPHSDAGEDVRDIWTPSWSPMIQTALGGHLVQALISVAKVKRSTIVDGRKIYESQPAFSHGYEYIRGRKLGVIRLNPIVATRLGRDRVGMVIHPKHLPMLVPPKKWTDVDRGAYLVHSVNVMRFKESIEQLSYLRSASQENHLEPVFHGLDVLSSTPWAINRKVFETVLRAWNEGSGIGDIPASEEKAVYEIPQKPDAEENDPVKRAIYVEQMKAVTAQQRKDHAERCKINYNLEIARSYLHDVFYIPHNMDFRGRAYPIPPHLSPVGDDLCRGLLTFGEKKPLGEEGFRWLRIHLANVFGFDKASFDERARFAQDHEEDILDSADRPLEGNRWWLKAEDPWQCLAACHEIAAAIRSPDITQYESSLPIHQDGTCNGMQHYAALGGDPLGAKAVNLENGDRPADIYTGVADLVNKVIEEDKKAGIALAIMIGTPLGRKVVKQTVMTTVYGVTFVGAREQIAKQLIARGGIPPEHVYQVSAYVARIVLACIGDLFRGARAIQDWLTISARLICRSIPPERVQEAVKLLESPSRKAKNVKKTRINKELMTSVVWTTPLGLPVVQPYRKAVKKQVMTALQSVYISDPNLPTEVSPGKQATAFPPNFIHSLDATHMLLTAAKCSDAGITFASVHDSYWTHASSVRSMADILRDSFVHIHSQDITGELRKEFLERYADHFIPVENAQSISDAALKRNTQRSAKSKKVDEALAEDLEGDEPTIEDVETASVAAELTQEELAALAPASTKLVGERINGQKFVRFADVLPQTPPRGDFDVKRIRDSAYFFS